MKRDCTLLQAKFNDFKIEISRPLNKGICELFILYNNAMSWFFSDNRDIEQEGMDGWRACIDLASVKAHQIYLELLDYGVLVEYNKTLEKNRLEDCGYGPKYLPFHQHNHAIEDLLNFCIIGTTDRKFIKRLEKEYAST
jgi:hypothetical protein